MRLSDALDTVHTFILEELETRERSLMPDPGPDYEYIESAKTVERAITDARMLSDILLEACKVARLHLQPDLVEPGRTVFWKLVSAINRAEGKQ